MTLNTTKQSSKCENVLWSIYSEWHCQKKTISQVSCSSHFVMYKNVMFDSITLVMFLWRKCTLPCLQTNLSHLSTRLLTTRGSHGQAHGRTQTPEHSRTILSVYISRDSHTVPTVIQLVICTTLIIYFNYAHLAHCYSCALQAPPTVLSSLNPNLMLCKLLPYTKLLPCTADN